MYYMEIPKYRRRYLRETPLRGMPINRIIIVRMWRSTRWVATYQLKLSPQPTRFVCDSWEEAMKWANQQIKLWRNLNAYPLSQEALF